jgi:hypothetical protein
LEEGLNSVKNWISFLLVQFFLVSLHSEKINMNKNMGIKKEAATIEEVWEYTKRNFKIGKDYIETETEDYIVFCPFNYCVLSFFDDALMRFGSFFRFQHCVCNSFSAFCYWYEKMYQDGMLKTFFIRKNLDLAKCALEYREDKDLLAEFTGWISFSERNFLYFAHPIDNNFITGEFSFDGYDKRDREHVMARTVAKGSRKLVDKMNSMVNEVYDDLFAQYDVHINELEKTLYNILEK